LELITGLPDGYCNKLLADPPAKNIGITSLGKLLKGLALKLNVVEDAEQLQKIEPLVPRYESNVRTAPLLDPVAAYKIWFARRGGRARWRSTTPEERSAIARAAANFRWHGNANGKANGHT
jgi:hypothetical protein